MEENKSLYYTGLGRRKRAVARVKLTSGKGKIVVNGEDPDKYFPTENLIKIINKPTKLINSEDKYDVSAILTGGGHAGQAVAMALGISRALIKCDPQLRPQLKKAGLLRRDPREKERKKYGLRGARRRFQFSKR